MRAVLREGRRGLARAGRSYYQPERFRVISVAHLSSSQRFFVDEKDSAPAVLPGSQSKTAPNTPPAPTLKSSPSDSSATPSIAPSNVPRTPPSPAAVSSSGSEKASTTMPPSGYGSASTASSPSPPKKKKRRVRNFFLFTTTALALSYAGGVYYSLKSDSFHDFFTEYIPFGEDVVLYFEEREYKRRFGDRAMPSHHLYPQPTGETKVTVSGRSGVSAKVSQEPGDSQKSSAGSKPKSSAPKDGLGKTDRAIAKPAKSPAEPPKSKPLTPSDGLGKTDRAMTESKTARESSKTQSKPSSSSSSKSLQASTQGSNTDQSSSAKTSPKASEVDQIKPIQHIDIINVENAADPLVQEMSKILNDVITVVNADNASNKYSSTMVKAKDAVQKLASEVEAYRKSASQDAEERIHQSQAEVEKQAQDLLSRLQQEQRDQELRWREEYETERERLSHSYEGKLKSEIEAAQRVADQKLKNELLEQQLRLTDSFKSSVRNRVERERSARLSKLQELSSKVKELDQLTSQWGSVVDANVKTQHFVVAVDAVRSVLDSADRPKPFVHELAALKETADGNPVVNAAIASINPTAYQRGIPTAGQLIDRFRGVAAEVRKASLLPEDAGAASHAASFLLSKVLFKKQGLAVGDDVESVLTRTETLLEEGNLNEATREMNTLTGWAKVLSKDWLTECRRVLEVKQALDVISAEARLQSLLVK